MMKKILSAVLCLTLVFSIFAVSASAATVTDELLNYEITATVNDDGTVRLDYHVDWKVLDDKTYGPLEWINFGIPNERYDEMEALSSTISSIQFSHGYDGGSYAEIYFDKKYKKNETVSFDFYVVSDFMYKMNGLKQGETVFDFTPGWFDGMIIDNLTVKWNADKVSSVSDGGKLVGDYYVWTASLKSNEKINLQVSYPNDAYDFDDAKSYSDPYALDRIKKLAVTADIINDDAVVRLNYHFEWKVLDDKVNGPLTQLSIEVPNSKYINYGSDSSSVQSVSMRDGYSYSYADVLLDRPYYKGDIAVFDFYVEQDYMYWVDRIMDGETEFRFFTPWFSEVTVDEFTLRWNAEKVASYSDGAVLNDGYLEWTKKLEPYSSASFYVYYPDDAYNFDSTKTYDVDDDWDDDDDFGFFDLILGLILMLLGVAMIFAPFIIAGLVLFGVMSGFANGRTQKKITRTKIVYFPSCPGCGAPRKEGHDTCDYCGRSMIQSEEIIKEEDLPESEKGILKYKHKGIYHYSSEPNTYVRVNVVHVPAPAKPSSSSSSRTSSRPTSGRSSRGGSGRGGSSGGGCAHSSCACACASCACACACACAGGGRAGCTTKDFYNTKLKLAQIERKAKKK